MKNSLNKMPFIPAKMPAYFTACERLFNIRKIEEQFRVQILNPFLTKESRALLSNMREDEVSTFEKARDAILKFNKLSTSAYRDMFYKAVKGTTETYAQYVTVLQTNLGYYLKS